ncbi:hypothetical protein DIPPA_31260 [Diplonema papillatum]|nr:hypothetical protein DIPPA_31260 [Diplonema papillatum]
MANTPAARPPETAEAGGREEEKDAEEKDTSSGTNPLDLALPTAPLPLEILREDQRNVLDAGPLRDRDYSGASKRESSVLCHRF